MTRTLRPGSLALALAVFSLFVLLSCGKESSPPTNPFPDPNGAKEKVALANAALERILYDELNAPEDPDQPGDVAFDEPYALYKEAIDLDSGNLDAHFGYGITSLLILSSDSEVNAAFDEWKAYLDERTPFEIESRSNRPLGVPLGFADRERALSLPYEIVPLSVFALVNLPLMRADPQIERIQAILRDRVLPHLAQAEDHLGVASQDGSYRFIVTPRMQGDEEADPAEVDKTDILATESACALLSAACRIAVAYRLGFAAYDSTSLHSAVQPGSNFLRLQDDGAQQMEQARVDILTSIDRLDSAILSLLAETDSQSDDVIKIGPDDLSRADVDSVRVHLDDARAALTTEFTRVDDWDGDRGTPDQPLTISLANFFRNPPPGLKSLLPPYTAWVERRAWSTTWDSNAGQQDITLDIPQDGTYSASYSLRVYEGGDRDTYFYGDDLFRASLETIAEEFYSNSAGSGGYLTEFGCYLSYYGSLHAGRQTVSVRYQIDEEWAVSFVAIPVIRWEATRFEDWRLPDPTMRGLLPNINSTAEAWDLFGVDGDGWERELVLDWSD